MPSLDELKAKFAAIFEAGIENLVVRVDPISDSTNFVFSMSLNRMPTVDGKKLDAALALAKEAGMDFLVHPEAEESVCVELRKEQVQLVF